ncbi:50S ribosomal protein L35 [Patescibacteria group bacterium]|nr:50S ribosomal protein L35 [Patescibacteria group bacterium]
MKVKTHKATAKRFKITGRKKLLKRTAGQSHFNARETSTVTRRKRRDTELAKVNVPAVRKLIKGA